MGTPLTGPHKSLQENIDDGSVITVNSWNPDSVKRCHHAERDFV